jgi:hypothetical protein
MGKKDHAKSGQKKVGRMSRKPAHSRYNSEERWKTNKAKRIAKQKKKEEKAKLKKELRNNN